MWTLWERAKYMLLIVALLAGGARVVHYLQSGRTNAHEPQQAGAVVQPARPTGKLALERGQLYALAEAIAPLCRTQEMFDKVMELAGDRQALEKALPQVLLSGECTYFEAGTALYFEEASFWAGRARVRKKGETTSYWTGYDLLHDRIKR